MKQTVKSSRGALCSSRKAGRTPGGRAALTVILGVGAFLVATAPPAAAQSQPTTPHDIGPPERPTNRKLRTMNELRRQRREEAQNEQWVDRGYGHYSSSSGINSRGAYYSEGGRATYNPGGNALGQNGSAFPNDGGVAFPTVPNNR